MTNVRESVHDRIERQRQENIDRNMTSLNKLGDGLFILTAPFGMMYKFIKSPLSKRKKNTSKKEVISYGQVNDVALELTKGVGKLIKFGINKSTSIYNQQRVDPKTVKKGFFSDFKRNRKQKQKEKEARNKYIVDNLIRHPGGLEAGVAAHNRALEAMNKPPPPAMPESVDSDTTSPLLLDEE